MNPGNRVLQEPNDEPACVLLEQIQAARGNESDAGDPPKNDGEATLARDDVAKGLKLILEGIEILQQSFSNRNFTIDGRLVGDIGEIIAAAEFDITLDEISQAHHDGKTSDGRRVQIKATFKDSLTFRSVPDYYLGLKLDWDGTHEVIFNGPGHVISDFYQHRRGIGKQLLSFPLTKLRELSASIAEVHRIPRRSPEGYNGH